MTRTALVVVSYASHALLERHLAATTAGAAGEDSPTVVVVDSFSDEREREAVARVTREHGWLLVTTVRNGGFGAGVNAGARRARELGCDVLVVLNPDLDVDAATVEALAQVVRDDPSTLVGPRIVKPDGLPWFAGGTLDLRTGRTRTTVAPGAAVQWVSGACFAVSTDLWHTVGGFDEDYFLYWEDVDLSWRVRAAGGRLLVREDLVAIHEVGGTQATAGTRAKSLGYYRHNCRGRLLFAAKHLPPAAARHWAGTAPRYALEVVLRGGRRQLLRSPAPLVAAALGTLDGLRAVRRRELTASPAPDSRSRPRRLLVAHPSPDLYGSDRQMLETVAAAVAVGWDVEVVLPCSGPLVPHLQALGAGVRFADVPVLRKAVMHPRRLLGFAAASAVAVRSIRSALRADPPDLVYVSTVTIPVWLLGARLAHVPAMCHVHEAEEGHPRLVALALAAPLALADRVVANSEAARRALERAAPRIGRSVRVVHNGVPARPQVPAPRERTPDEPWELVLVGRLSPRKGIDIALEAVALLAAEGRDVHLSVCGTIFGGYEWYERDLRERASRPDLAGRVDLLGYVHPTWPLLDAADVVLVPSRTEPFGNTAVEGLLARRAVVASGVQGLNEVLTDGRTGLLVPPGDPVALAAAVALLIDDPDLRSALAENGYADAVQRFSTQRYAEALQRELDLASSARPARRFTRLTERRTRRFG